LSTLYIRLPSHAVADSLSPGVPMYCQFASVSGSGAIERDGVAALSELSDPVGRAQRVVLLLAASDVTLLRVKVPPLSPARLKVALPNLVEDQLMSDPEECVIVAAASRDEVRMVAVVQRSWMELLSKTMLALGARNVSALPSQLCLPFETGSASATVTEHGTDVDVAVRLAEQEGIGLSIVADQPESAAFDVMQSLVTLVPQAQITLYVPSTRLRDYQDSLHIAPALDEHISLREDSWQQWIKGADDVVINLMSGLGAASGPKIDWQRWRWPIVLGVALLAVNVIGLNVDWMRLKREAEALRMGMIQTYKSAFPKETVIVDPLAQLRQKMAATQRGSGQLAPDDFLALAAAFGEAWAGSGQGPAPIAGMEYRDRALTVKLKPGSSASPDQLNSALAARNLSISQQSAGVWQIRRAK
jgi:general secretion pathway protein L